MQQMSLPSHQICQVQAIKKSKVTEDEYMQATHAHIYKECKRAASLGCSPFEIQPKAQCFDSQQGLTWFLPPLID